MDWLAFKTHPSQINQDAFAQAMLRHMVQLQVGRELSDAEYSTAVKAAIQVYGLKEHNGAVDLREKSAGSISAIGSQISEVLQRPESEVTSAKRGTPA
ncbi:MAG TPA: hypothetical protein VHO71_04550 [Caproiciproducens sp.]|nr:hypothetical protein [Caproiciproducens sp.]